MIPRPPLAILAGLLVAAAPAPAPSPELAQVQDHLRAVKTMTADFQQTDPKGRQVGGTIQLSRPGKVRFQYQKGVPLLVVGDGKALTMIDYQVRQVSRYPIGKTPLALLLDPDRDVSGIAHAVPSASPDEVTIAAADPKHREAGAITVVFRQVAGAPGGLVPEGWTVTDAQNGRTTVRLANVRFGVAIPDSAFRWVDPRVSAPR